MFRLLLSFVVLFYSCNSLVADKPLSIVPVVQNSDWAKKWWMSRHKEKLALKEKMGKVDLVFLGDSITHDWDNKGKSVWDKYYKKRNALNLGFAGDKTENVLWRLNNGAVDGIHPKLVVLMIGTNNTGGRQDKPEDTALGIKTILNILSAKLPEAKVLMLAIFPRGAQPDDKLRVINHRINKIIQDYADNKKIFWLNINQKFLNEKGVLERAVMDDLLHPNQDQYQVWADAIEPKVQEFMEEAG